jgi:hypothetical protein
MFRQFPLQGLAFWDIWSKQWPQGATVSAARLTESEVDHVCLDVEIHSLSSIQLPP